jgi:flagellar basal-body rod modification protein FlgD
MTSALDNLTRTAGTTGTPATPATSGGQTLDRQAFLKLLIAQVRQQDPLKPMEGTEFVTQLAQFSVVEQAIEQSRQLDVVGAQIRGLSNNASTDLVGRTVTVRGNTVAWDGAQSVPVNTTLQGDASEVTLAIRNAAGDTVRTVRMPAQRAGTVSYTWDGKDDRGAAVPRGAYSVAVTARNAQGVTVPATQDVTGRVLRVGYERGYPELEIEGGARAPISDLVSVSAPTTPTPTNNR